MTAAAPEVVRAIVRKSQVQSDRKNRIHDVANTCDAILAFTMDGHEAFDHSTIGMAMGARGGSQCAYFKSVFDSIVRGAYWRYFDIRRTGRGDEFRLNSIDGFLDAAVDVESVYAVRCGEYVKIGVAKRPLSRLRNMQVSNPVELTLESRWPGSADVEKMFHGVLSPLRVRGEWFMHPQRLSLKELRRGFLN